MRPARSWDGSGFRSLNAMHGPLAPIALLLALVTLMAGCAASSTTGSSGASHTASATFTTAQQSQLASAVSRAVADETSQVQVSQVQVQYEMNRTVQVTITIGWTATYTADDVPEEQKRVKSICFAAQKALWTSGLAMTDALVIVIGPVTDEYGSPTTAAHGTAELSAATASALSWATLDPASAWSRYDHVYLRDTYTFSA